MMYRMNYRDCSELRARRRNQRRAVMTTVFALAAVAVIVWAVLQ